MVQVRLDNSRLIKLRRLVQFNNSKSMGIVIPSKFVAKMGLRAGEYMAVEMDGEGNSLTLSRCSLTMPCLTNIGEEEK
jgi:hypothetical protein